MTPRGFEHHKSSVETIDIRTLEENYQFGQDEIDAETIECLGIHLKRLTKQDKDLDQIVKDMIVSPQSFWEINFKCIYDFIISQAGNVLKNKTCHCYFTFLFILAFVFQKWEKF